MCAEPDQNSYILVSVFDVPRSDLADFYRREDFFRVTEVRVSEYPAGSWATYAGPGAESSTHALMCLKFADDDELIATNFGSRELFNSRYSEHYQGAVYRRDLMPCKPYLKHCLVAAERLGAAFRANFETSTFLGDGRRTIRDYLDERPGWDEQTPLGTFDRYQG